METNGSGENQSGLCPCTRYAGRGWPRGSACWGAGLTGLAGVRGGGADFALVLQLSTARGIALIWEEPQRQWRRKLEMAATPSGAGVFLAGWVRDGQPCRNAAD